MSTQILIADDHEVARQMIRRVLSQKRDWEVCAEAKDGVEAVDLARRLSPDVAVVDIQMPRMNGLEAARQLVASCPNTCVLVESFHDVRPYADQLRAVGVRGSVQKDRIDTDLIPAIEAVLHGKESFYACADPRIPGNKPSR